MLEPVRLMPMEIDRSPKYLPHFDVSPRLGQSNDRAIGPQCVYSLTSFKGMRSHIVACEDRVLDLHITQSVVVRSGQNSLVNPASELSCLFAI